jgi:protein-tyrosine phosphatase
MVCLGNICRSPMAAAVAGAMLDEAGLSSVVTVESFGTAGYHVGERIDASAEEALRRHGWSAAGHRARRLERSDVEAADLVLCADNANLADVRRLAGRDGYKAKLLRSYDPASPAGAEVPDPWGGNDADFDDALLLIEGACRGLAAELSTAHR